MTSVFSSFERSQANSEQKGSHNDGRFEVAPWIRTNTFHGSHNKLEAIRRFGDVEMKSCRTLRKLLAM